MRFSDWSSDVCSSDLLLPFGAPAGDVVQAVLQPGGEIIGDIALEEPLKEGRHKPPFFLRDKAVLFEPHIGPVHQGLERRRIGRWMADAERTGRSQVRESGCENGESSWATIS